MRLCFRPDYAFEVSGSRRRSAACPLSLRADAICATIHGRKVIQLDNVNHKLVLFAKSLVSRRLMMESR